uniref:Zinc finger, CCHC-type n=1 Tax=Tanacetum cinerariifolium TaxID=118510 RepID=A0A6L2MIM0_TANCI|nr:zinc finger, CCHC-type [Tanacetum cinerariifolium]
MFERQARVERFDLIQTFHACKQEEGILVAAYVLQMKGYEDQLECLGYVLPQDLTVGLILNGLTKDFAGFVRNYNMHNMGKTIGELHAMLIEYKKGLPKKAETPQVMMIKGDKIQKSNKKSLKAKGKGKTNGKGKGKQVYIPKPKNLKPAAKEHPTKDDTCHRCKEVGHSKRNFPAYLVELIKKKQVGTASSSDIFVIELFSFPSKSWVYDTSCGLLKSPDDESFDQCLSCLSGKMTRKSFPHRPKRATDLLRTIHTDVCGPLRHVLRQVARYFITFTDDYSRYGYVYLLKHKHELTLPYTPQHNGMSEKRNRALLDMVRSMMNLITMSLSFWDYALESAIPTKKVDKTPYELWDGKVPNLSYLKVWEHEALVNRDTPDNLQQRSVKCIFICYPKETMGYYFYFLPENKIVVARDRSKRLIGLGQNAFMEKILKRYKMNNSKPGHIPMQEKLDLNKTQGASTPKEVKRMQNVPYASAVGSTVYAVKCTRPDAAFAQKITSQFQQNLDESHWTAVKNILKYLRNTKDLFLVYGRNPKLNLELIAIAMLDLRPI